VKCRIGVNATDCTSSMPNALKSNAELNAELNARVRARGIKKCHSYGVERNTTVRIDRSDGKGDDLTANQQDCGDSQPEENPTGTILGNQAIEQPTNAYVNIRQ